ALVAIEHTLLTAIWHMITADVGYTDLGGDYYTRRNPDKTKQRALAQLASSATPSPSTRYPPLGDLPGREPSSRQMFEDAGVTLTTVATDINGRSGPATLARPERGRPCCGGVGRPPAAGLATSSRC
ncbi:MAG TPA: hypothetical protein VFJ97_10290, partial [Dermatophilaceae bacterium]|nr:hypothetical protein [Dermatophilaceae bacterium]